MFNLENPIPKEKLVVIKGYQNKDILGGIPLILDDEFSIKVNSKYSELWQGSSSGFMNLMASGFGLPSGQFALQGVQVWESTDPIEISITVKLEMDTDPYLDVISPIITLMDKTAPQKGGSGASDTESDANGLKKAFNNLKLKTLIPPGPNLQSIWNAIASGNKDDKISKLLDKFGKARGVFNVDIGYAHFYSVIIKSVEPTFSKEMAVSISHFNKKYPSSASVAIELCTMEVATTGMISSIFG